MPTKAQLTEENKGLVAEKKTLSAKLNKKQQQFNKLDKDFKELEQTHRKSAGLHTALAKADENIVNLEKECARHKDNTEDLQRAVRAFSKMSWLSRALMSSGDIQNWITLEIDHKN